MLLLNIKLRNTHHVIPHFKKLNLMFYIHYKELQYEKLVKYIFIYYINLFIYYYLFFCCSAPKNSA